MSRKGKPIPPDRNWAPPLWELLRPNERDHLRSTLGLPRDWVPGALPEASEKPALEGLAELGRIMRMPPGRIAQLKEELIQRNQPTDEDE